MSLMDAGALLDSLSRFESALHDVDVASLSDEDLHELVLGVQTAQSRLAAVSARAVGAWDQRMVWAADGSRSAAARLASETRASMATARSTVRRARKLASMPATASALATGEIGVDHVDLLARANADGREELFAEHEADLVRHCTTLRFFDARKVVDYWCNHADADAADEAGARLREKAHLSLSSTLDGTVVVNGVLDPVGGEIVTNELTRLERELYLADQADGTVRTASQRKAAALVEMATRSNTAPADGKRPTPLFTALVGDRSVERLCELASGTVISPGDLVRWAGDAQLESVLFDGPSTVISVSHRRTFTGALRRAIQVRDRRCQHRSGCDEPGDRCDVDHIVAHADHGPTSQFNGKLECSPHNRNRERHGVGGEPAPSRTIDRLDELRCRLRWRFQREVEGNPDEFVDVAAERTRFDGDFDM